MSCEELITIVTRKHEKHEADEEEGRDRTALPVPASQPCFIVGRGIVHGCLAVIGDTVEQA
jgi:hypothetical protein